MKLNFTLRRVYPMKKWYIDRCFVYKGRLYDRGYYIREDGIIEWAEPIDGGEILEFPVEECYHTFNPLSSEPSVPIAVEDGELLGDMCDGWDAVEIEEIIERKENFPIDGEAYIVAKTEDGRYCFAWGPKFPYSNKVPSYDINDGDSGISFYTLLEDALEEMNEAVEAVEITLKEGSNC